MSFFYFFLPDRQRLYPYPGHPISTRQHPNPNRLVLVLPTMTRQVHLNIVKKKRLESQNPKSRKSDKRPVGARRPRYAASGDVACPGEGEGGSEFEPVDDPMEMSGEEVRLLVKIGRAHV